MAHNNLFEQPEIWANYDSGGVIKNKISLIKKFIPKDVRSIIDVGCGNGIITNSLAEKYDITGLDVSKEALKYLNTATIQSSIDDIPCQNKTFDLTLSSEVLEHLPASILQKSVDELKRISKKYLLITVPNEEFLPQTYTKCPKCKNVFHAYGHLNSFNLQKIVTLVGKDFKLIDSFIGGPKRKEYNPTILKLRHEYGDRYFNIKDGFCYCESCKNTSFPEVKGNLVSKICNATNKVISVKKDYWLFTLFTRDNS